MSGPYYVWSCNRSVSQDTARRLERMAQEIDEDCICITVDVPGTQRTWIERPNYGMNDHPDQQRRDREIREAADTEMQSESSRV